MSSILYGYIFSFTSGIKRGIHQNNQNLNKYPFGCHNSVMTEGDKDKKLTCIYGYTYNDTKTHTHTPVHAHITIFW